MEQMIARDLLSISAVVLRPSEPFKWACGTESPINCDSKRILSYPAVRSRVEAGLADLIRENFGISQVVMGVGTGGVAHAAIVSTILDMPMGYVRGATGSSTLPNIEGRLEVGQKVVVVEDLVSDGQSIVDVVSALREAGADVLGAISIFDYSMKSSKEVLAKENIKVLPLCTLDTLLVIASQEGYIKVGDVSRVAKFRDNPTSTDWKA